MNPIINSAYLEHPYTFEGWLEKEIRKLSCWADSLRNERRSDEWYECQSALRTAKDILHVYRDKLYKEIERCMKCGNVLTINSLPVFCNQQCRDEWKKNSELKNTSLK